jgi:hypothetical protein
VTAVGVPPSAETIDSPDRNALEKMIRPSVFQTAPEPPCALHTMSGSPPLIDTL